MSDLLLKADSIGKSFGTVHALKNVSFSLYKGEVVALVGDNGAGKSTLIKILSGVCKPSFGSLAIQGRQIDLQHYSVRKARSLGIETVYQERSLGEKQPLWRNIFVGRHIRNRFGFIDIKKEKEITLAMLTNSIGLQGAGVSADALVSNLSGGERQGLAISRAMHFNAALTILDEPTTALSVKEVRKVLNYIRSIPDRGQSALFVSHNLHHVHEIADRILFISRGAVAQECRKEDISVADLFQQLEAFSVENCPLPEAHR